MVKETKLVVKKIEYFLIRIFWIGQDPPPFWPKVKQPVFYAAPYDQNHDEDLGICDTDRLTLDYVDSTSEEDDNVNQLYMWISTKPHQRKKILRLQTKDDKGKVENGKIEK